MFSNAHNLTISLPLHHALQRSQSLAHLQHLTLNNNLLALGNGPEVTNVQVASDAEKLPEARLADENQGNRGAQVKESGCRAAVEIAEAVAVLFETGE